MHDNKRNEPTCDLLIVNVSSKGLAQRTLDNSRFVLESDEVGVSASGPLSRAG